MFSKYLHKQCSPAELEEFIQLLQKADAEQDLDSQMKAVWDSLRDNKQTFEADWQKIYNFVVTSQQHTDHLLQNATRKNKVLLYSIASFTGVLLICGIAYFLLKDNRPGTPVSNPVAQVSPATTKGQVIHLPDGSMVTLNDSSRLQYPTAFNSNRRDVYLEGEAFFDIQHQDGKPFYVHAGALTIRVLGTAFNIKAYSPGQAVKVTVTRGKVQVLRDSSSLGILTASQQMSVSHMYKEVKVQVVDTQIVTSWKPAEIFFTDMSLKEVLQSIGERYNLKVTFINPGVADCRVTATFSENDTPAEMLDVLCAVSKTTYNITNNTITIDGKGCD